MPPLQIIASEHPDPPTCVTCGTRDVSLLYGRVVHPETGEKALACSAACCQAFMWNAPTQVAA